MFASEQTACGQSTKLPAAGFFCQRNTVPLLTLEHSRAAYRADFAIYGVASMMLGLTLAVAHPSGTAGALLLWSLAGAAIWSPVEYLLHRFVLHGLPPFARWHAEHHQRPTALIALPTPLSAALFATLAALPAWWLMGAWPATALVFGLITGYLLYGLIHHAMHHAVPGGRAWGGWLVARRRWHAQHHAAVPEGAARRHFGVTSSLWDRVFGTADSPSH